MPRRKQSQDEGQPRVEVKPPESEGDREHLIGALAAALVAVVQKQVREVAERKEPAAEE
jgi:hypothetical protein